jgi:hypothetical protein
MKRLVMVEAAGVEPMARIDNRQLADFTFATKSSKTMIANSAVQTLYKNLNEFHERQPSSSRLISRRRNTPQSTILNGL